MARPCECCGETMQASSARKRFCSTTCRVKAHEARRSGGVASISGAPAVTVPAALEHAILGVLEQVGREASPLGASALLLGRRIDAGNDPGSALAALNRELRATLAEALRGEVRSSVTSLRDDLAERRARG